jgi:hypothetical protein
MIDIPAAVQQTNPPAQRAGANGGNGPPPKPRLRKVLLGENADTVSIFVDGRDAWALLQLIDAGEAGCTPINNPAPRWGHYIWKLRRAGIVIETITEPHGGPFAGHHARYVLRSKLRVVDLDHEEVL